MTSITQKIHLTNLYFTVYIEAMEISRRQFLFSSVATLLAPYVSDDAKADAFQSDLIKLRDYLSTFRNFLNYAIASGNISQAEYSNLMSIRNSIFGRPACTHFVISNLETLSMNLRLRINANPYRSEKTLYWMKSYSNGFKWYANRIKRHCTSKGIPIR